MQIDILQINFALNDDQSFSRQLTIESIGHKHERVRHVVFKNCETFAFNFYCANWTHSLRG
jgi:hypothetical protein